MDVSALERRLSKAPQYGTVGRGRVFTTSGRVTATLKRLVNLSAVAAVLARDRTFGT